MTTIPIRKDDGKFNGSVAQTHSEATGVHLPVPHAPKAQKLSEMRIEPGDSMPLDTRSIGSDIFESIEVIRDDDGSYRAEGGIYVDFAEGLVGDMPEGERDAYLNDRLPDIEAYLADEYQVELDAGMDQWSDQRLVMTAENLYSDADADSVVNRLERYTFAVQVHNELNGAFGTRNFWNTMKDHLDKQDGQRDRAIKSYTRTEVPGIDNIIRGEITAKILDPGSAQLVEFLRANRADLAAAMKMRPNYEFAEIGRDFSMSRDPGRSGSGFWARGFGDVGSRLDAAACAYGETPPLSPGWQREWFSE